MFEVTELYAAWTEDPQSFYTEVEATPQALQEQLTVDPETILDEDLWTQIMLSSCPPAANDTLNVNNTIANEWLGTIINALRDWSHLSSLRALSQERQAQCQEALEKLLFLSRMHFARLKTALDSIPASQANARKASTGHTGDQLVGLLGALSRTLQSGISAVFPATLATKRSAIAMLYLEPSFQLMQHEIVLKDARLVKEILRVICNGVKLQQQDAIARVQSIELITLYPSAVPAVVDILQTLRVQFDHSSLAEGVLKDLAVEAANWTESQSTATTVKAKAVNTFLTQISEVSPSLIVANLSAIAMLIGSPVPQLRQAVLDVAVPVIRAILDENSDRTVENTVQSLESLAISLPTNSGERDSASRSSSSIHAASSSHANSSSNLEDSANEGTDNTTNDVNAGPNRLKAAFDLIKLVELRVNDVSHFCRLRAVQVLACFAEAPAFISRRNVFAEIAVQKMKDRTQLVRKQAMRLMKELIDTHPPVMHTNNLSRELWQSSLAQITEELDRAEPSDISNQLEAARAFVLFTLEFLNHVDESLAVAQTLLLSKSKSDIMDAIDLLEYADAYNIETSKPGIRSVLHLVWAKADNDEENAVLSAAVKTYRDLFMTAPPQLDARRYAQVVADNLINLTNDASEGELTSLERLLSLAVDAEYISVAVVGRLWGLYQTESEISPKRRRGAAIVLSMLSSADRSIARSGISSVVKIGLGAHGRADLKLAEYSCTILRKFMDPLNSTQARLPENYELFESIINFLVEPVKPRQSMDWPNLAKEALGAMCNLCDCAPNLYGQLIREYIDRVFKDKSANYTELQRQQLLAQLLFLVGEVALNLLIYLERSDLAYKKRSQEERSKTNSSQSNTKTTAEQEDEMMAGGASREDDFEDVLRDIREDVILFSDTAILKPFSDLVAQLCQQQLNESAEQSKARQELLPNTTEYLSMIGVTQSLAKFMCVSSRYCERNLPLLMDLLARHSHSVVRSNLVVALSDIAVSFNRLIDKHTEYLYDRLQDSDPEVQRTCIVALTFLILAGQIKVKGKLGEMAKAVAHPNREIAKLTTMFFRELATKENAIYNSFLDMLSTLVTDESLSESDMLRIIKFLSMFIDRERHMKQLSDKLIKRLPRCSSQRQWNAYIQVLRHLPRKLDDETKEIINSKYQRNPGEQMPDDDEEEDIAEDPNITAAYPTLLNTQNIPDLAPQASSPPPEEEPSRILRPATESEPEDAVMANP